jgi:hypothetical protein
MKSMSFVYPSGGRVVLLDSSPNRRLNSISPISYAFVSALARPISVQTTDLRGFRLTIVGTPK